MCLALSLYPPAHSSELYATMHQEMVSPIHMPGGAPGMYRDSSEYDLDGNVSSAQPPHIHAASRNKLTLFSSSFLLLSSCLRR